MKTPLLVAALLAAFSTAAFAQSKGSGGSTSGGSAAVIVIDQAKAEAGGVTPGDAPGFPVTISQPGRYRLASNLTVSTADVKAIDITADHVTLDLDDFAIVGPVACSGSSPAAITCAPQSNSVAVSAPSRRNVTVRNGSLRGFSYGAFIGWDSRIERLNVSHMSITGLLADAGSQIVGNVVSQIGGVGISGYADMRDNAVRWARVHGISAGFGSLVVGNRVSGAGQYGIEAYEHGHATLIHNSVTGGGLGAISQGVKVDGNACSGTLCQ